MSEQSIKFDVETETFEPLRENNFLCLVGNQQETLAEDIPDFSDADHVIDWVLMMSTCDVIIDGRKLELGNHATKDYVKRYPSFNIMSLAPEKGYQGYVYLRLHTVEGKVLAINKLLCSYKGYKTKLLMGSDSPLMIIHEFEIEFSELVLDVQEEQKKFSTLKGEHVFNVKCKEVSMTIYSCLSCGYQYSGNYCPKCGQPHDEKIAEQKQIKKICSACSTVNEYNSAYCVECGESFRELLMEGDSE